MSHVPEDLQRKIDDLLAMARAVDGAVADLCDRFREVSEEYTSARNPSLDEDGAPGCLDTDLMERCGINEADAVLAGIFLRVKHAHDDPDGIEPAWFRRYGLTGPAFDAYELNPPWVETQRLLDGLEQVGEIMRIRTAGEDE